MAKFNAYGFAWRHAHKVPSPIYRGLCNLAADIAWLTSSGGVDQLAKNLARVRPDLDARQIRRLTRAGMRSYMRYFGEAFVLTHVSQEQLAARVRTVNVEPVREVIAQGHSPVLALSHQGNWDLAGAWASEHLAPVLTVAERLEPAEVFEEFLRFREQLGMRILAAGDPGVFRTLLKATRQAGSLLPILADRDLTRTGVEVDLFGRKASVAAGPAALTVSSGVPLFPMGVHYERLRGQRRKLAGSPWGIVLSFGPKVTFDKEAPRQEQIQQATQAWVDALSRNIARHPQDWHMLQKVFIEDLDPERYAQSRKTSSKEN